MERKYINLNNLPEEKIMTSYEMKNIVGGTENCAKCSGSCVRCECDDGTAVWYQCEGSTGSDWACAPGKKKCDPVLSP